jgi:hypothetical protein
MPWWYWEHLQRASRVWDDEDYDPEGGWVAGGMLAEMELAENPPDPKEAERQRVWGLILDMEHAQYEAYGNWRKGMMGLNPTLTYLVPASEFHQYRIWQVEQEWMEKGAEGSLEDHTFWENMVESACEEIERNILYWGNKGIQYDPFYTVFAMERVCQVEVVNPYPCPHALQMMAKRKWRINDFWG